MSAEWSGIAWFFAIVVAIPLALWWFKRTPIGARLAGGAMKSIAALPLSPSQRLVTVEVGRGDERRWLVLGVTPGSINLLYTLSPHDDPAAGVPAPTPAEGFAQLLSRLKHRRGGEDDGR